MPIRYSSKAQFLVLTTLLTLCPLAVLAAETGPRQGAQTLALADERAELDCGAWSLRGIRPGMPAAQALALKPGGSKWRREKLPGAKRSKKPRDKTIPRDGRYLQYARKKYKQAELELLAIHVEDGVVTLVSLTLRQPFRETTELHQELVDSWGEPQELLKQVMLEQSTGRRSTWSSLHCQTRATAYIEFYSFHHSAGQRIKEAFQVLLIKEDGLHIPIRTDEESSR